MDIKGLGVKLRIAHWLFASIALMAGFTYVCIVPPFWGLDETAHFLRVYQITHPQVHPQGSLDQQGKNPQYLPSNLVELRNYAIGDLVDNNTNGVVSRKDVDDVDGYKRLTDAKFSKNVVVASIIATYSPVAYAGPIIGTVLAEVFNTNIGHTIFLARLFSLFLYVLVGWLAIRLLCESKLRWLFMIILLLPTSLFQGSVISADGILISISLLFTALFIRLLKADKSESNFQLLYAMTIIAVLLPLIKLNYIFLSLLVLFIPNNIFTNKKIVNFVKLGGVLAAMLFGLLWQMLGSMDTSNSSVSQRPDGLAISMTGQIAHIINHPFDFIAAFIRSVVVYGDSYLHTGVTQVGWNYVDIPSVVLTVILMSLFIAAVYAKNEVIKVRKLLSLTTIVLLMGIISIFGILYAAFTPVGGKFVDGIQGRYFTPYLTIIMVLIGAFIPIGVKIKDRVAPFLFGGVSVLGLSVSIAYYFLVTY